MDNDAVIDPGRELGAAAAEYAVLVALIAGVVLSAVVGFGGDLPRPYEAACRALPGGNSGAASPPGNGGGLATAPGQDRGRRC